MQRIPEPEELMEDPAQAVAYARADFTEANQLFTELVERQAGTDLNGRLLDLGCGPGHVAARCEEMGVRVTGVE